MTSTASPDISIEGKPIRFVLDYTFFNDAFRSDYAENKSAKWFLEYVLYRWALDHVHKVCVTPALLLERFTTVAQAKGYGGITPQIIKALKAFVDIQSLTAEIKHLDDAALLVAKITFDQNQIPIILSSVKPDKWAERAKRLGIEKWPEQFSMSMSKKRLQQNIWYFPFDSTRCPTILKAFDQLYDPIVREIGYPSDK